MPTVPVQTDDGLTKRLRAYFTKDGSVQVGDAEVEGMGSVEVLFWIEFFGPENLAGTTFTPAEVNSANFGVFLQVPRDLAGESQTFRYIDAVRVTAYHNPPGGSLQMSIREVNKQQVLIGRETTLGSSVAANVRLRHARIQPQPSPDMKDHRPAGEKLPNHQMVLRESAEGPLDGIPTYDELGWLLASLIARPNTTTLESGAYRHVFVLDNRVRDVIASYTCEYGDMWSRAHKVTAMIINALEIGLRQDGADLGGSIIAQKIQDGITMSVGAATVQTITQSGTGTFALRFRGQETAALTAGASLTAAAVQTALRALPYINSSTQLTVTGADGGPFTVTFGNAIAGPFKGIRQPILEVRVLTPTPTVAVAMTTAGGHVTVPGVPILPRHVEFFLTATLANLASSKITEAYVTNFSMANRAAPVFNLDRSNESWFNYAEPSNMDVKMNLILHALSNAMAFLTNARNDGLLYSRILATGPAITVNYNHRLQVDLPVKVSNFGPFSENQETYAFEYELAGAFDEATNQTLVITLDNSVASYD